MLLIIDKPQSITSYDVIRILKQKYSKRKIGHGGTLDPMATGLLIVGIDQDTKKLGPIQTGPKTYVTTVDFSKNSDTWDMDYRDYFEEYSLQKDGEKIIGIQKEKKTIFIPSQDSIQQKLDSLIPSRELPLTPFCAKKKDGKKLYELARAGKIVSETREMKVSSAKILDYKFPKIILELEVGGGTYIRSIGHRLGQQFELGGILISLRRTKIGDINIDNIPNRETMEGEIKGKKVGLKIAPRVA